MESKYMKAEYVITIDGEPDFLGGYPLKEKRELVRCKDCRFFTEPDSHGDQCAKIHWSRGVDWFCADGERR